MKNKYLCLLFLLFSLVSMSAHAQIKVEGHVVDFDLWFLACVECG